MAPEPWYRRWEPAVGRPVLLLLSALMWTGVGVLLISLSLRRLPRGELLPVLVGLALTWPLFQLIFARLVRRNLARLAAKRERICVFAFQGWRVYLIVAVMMGLAIGLRYTGISGRWLGALYLAIGGGKLLAGLSYWVHLVKRLRG